MVVNYLPTLLHMIGSVNVVCLNLNIGRSSCSYYQLMYEYTPYAYELSLKRYNLFVLYVGNNGGKDFPKQFLLDIYERIRKVG